MPRKATLEFFVWSFKMLLAWLKCCFYILKYKPDVIFGTGGYVSAPVLCAGMTMKVPFVMHDCDANPGLVTRKFAPFAKSISVAFDVECEKLHNKNCVVNGNPIRKEFSTLTKEQARENLGLENKLTICVMGGSQGAKKINEAATGDHILIIWWKSLKPAILLCQGQVLSVYPSYAQAVLHPYLYRILMPPLTIREKMQNIC